MRRVLTRFTALLAAGALLACQSAGAAAFASAADLSGVPAIDAATSLLVIAPHPDDETLCCGGVIQRVLRAGGRVSVVWLTSGDAARIALLRMGRSLFPRAAIARELGAQRMQEARTAMTRLGVRPETQLFLGYPDGGLRALLGEHRTVPFTSPTTGAAAVPYADALYPAHAYTGESLERDLLAVLERVRPTLILAPTPLDAHTDHSAAGVLTETVSARYARALSVRYWIVHGGEGWPSPRALMPGVPMMPAPLAAAISPTAFQLEPVEEDGKLLALQAYQTQLRVMEPFLLSFVRTNELYSSLAH